MSDPVTIAAGPDPLWVWRHHSADYRAPYGAIDSAEMNRVLAYWRAGGYYSEPQGVDGYAPASQPDTSDTNGRHSADYQAPYHILDGMELTRVLAYWRAGGYGVNAAGADGYAPTGARSAPQSAGATATQQGTTTFDPAGTLTVAGAFNFSGSLLALRWRPLLPEGWSVVSVQGDGTPELQRGDICWTGALPASPIRLSYSVAVPAGELGARTIRGEVQYFASGMVNAATIAPAPQWIALGASG